MISAIAKVFERLNIPCDVDHAWSAEIDPVKRTFINTMFPGIRHLYGDADRAVQIDSPPHEARAGKAVGWATY